MLSHNLEAPHGDPLTALKHLNSAVHESFEYEPGVTQVHSPNKAVSATAQSYYQQQQQQQQ